MKTTNLVYVYNTQGQILLCAKKKTNSGFTLSLGKRNGAGGKVEPDETPLASAQRELQEETGINLPIEQFIHQGIIYFEYETKPDRDQMCYVYVIYNYDGTIHETEEMLPQRRDTDKLPYDHMRADDTYRMPRLLAGEYVEYKFFFDDQGIITHFQQLQ